MSIERNDIFLMLGHKLRVTSVIPYSGARGYNYERKVFLICTDDCNCCDKFVGKLMWPVKLQILERHLKKYHIDKL